MQNFITDFTKSPLGIIITPLLMSIIGTILYDIAKKIASAINKKYRKEVVKSNIEKATKLFVDSFKAGYSNTHSTMHQVIFASEYVLRMIRYVIIILVIGFFAVALIGIFASNIPLQMIVLSTASIAITIICLNAKETLKTQKTISSFVFGDAYFESEKKNHSNLLGAKTKRVVE